ncbi:MAG: hypothetical protein KIT69_11935, partial [Propionibacteriaceae bacterium]|nr:hypothetical protein [Propionibacteriaceae bacterium]
PVSVLLKVLGTAVVFWLAHVYAGAVSHLADEADAETSTADRLMAAVRLSLGHLWGMLAAPIVPAVALGASALDLISSEQAIWGTLWVNVALLALLGFRGVSRWSSRIWVCLVGALITAGFGLVLVLLKALIH